MMTGMSIWTWLRCLAEICARDPIHVDLWPASIKLLELQIHSHEPAAIEFTENMQYGTERAVQCLERAQQRQNAYADKGRHDVTYDVGQQLLMNT